MSFILGRSNGVEAPEASAPHPHEAGAPEVREMAGNRRLREAKDGDDIANAELSILQQGENT